MLTRAQYERLPSPAREIVATDRAIAAVIDRKVVPIEIARPGGPLRELLNERRSLIRSAASIWGRPLRNDGTAGS